MINNIQYNNLGTVNQNEVIIEDWKGGRFVLSFSYRTLVGISWHKGEKYGKAIIQNYWSATTGKLLNKLEPDKKKRLEREDFDQEVVRMFKQINKR